MKKSIIALSTMLFLAVGVSNAQTQESVVNETEQSELVQEATEPQNVEEAEAVDQDNKVEIKKEALPEAVLDILKSDRFNTWDVSRAYEIVKGDKKIYEVVLMNGEKKATYKFDEEGKTIG